MNFERQTAVGRMRVRPLQIHAGLGWAPDSTLASNNGCGRIVERPLYLISKHSGLFGLQVALKMRCKLPCKKVK
jgi:hypothetical protein